MQIVEGYSLTKKVHFIGTDSGSSIIAAFKDMAPDFEKSQTDLDETFAAVLR